MVDRTPVLLTSPPARVYVLDGLSRYTKNSTPREGIFHRSPGTVLYYPKLFDGGDIVLQKSGFPLENPLREKSRPAGYLHCPYCAFITKFSESLERHKARFHERELAGEGVKSPREGGAENKYTRQKGMVTCPVCGVSWGSQGWLDWHMANTHKQKEVLSEATTSKN